MARRAKGQYDHSHLAHEPAEGLGYPPALPVVPVNIRGRRAAAGREEYGDLEFYLARRTKA